MESVARYRESAAANAAFSGGGGGGSQADSEVVMLLGEGGDSACRSLSASPPSLFTARQRVLITSWQCASV